MTERVTERSAPQHMNPTPIGRIPSGVFGSGVFWNEVVASFNISDSVLTSVPAPRNPKPPARVTALARGQVAMRRIGAHTMSGLCAQGY